MGKIQPDYPQSTPASQRKMKKQVHIYSSVLWIEKPEEWE